MRDLKPSAIQDTCAPVKCETCGHRKDNPICMHDFSLPEIEKLKRDISFESGQIIFNSGEKVSSLYSVRSGLVKLETYSESGSAHTVQMVGPGAAFGFRHLFSNLPSTATAVALENSEICVLPMEQILPIISNRKEILMSLISKLSEGVEVVEKKWLHQMDLGAVERVAEALVYLNDQFPSTQWTRKDIAQWAGTTPETVIRTLAQFEKEGLIDQSEGRSIKLVNILSLKSKYNS